MRKNVIATMIVCLLSTVLWACDNGLPDFTTQEAYDLGVEAYECMDDFCNGSMNADTLEKKLTDIYSVLEEIENDHEKNDKNNDYINDGSIYLRVSSALSALSLMDDGETYGVEDARDDLAEILELKQ